MWGYTGFEQESDSSASFELYVNLYAAGVPCPRYEGNFCNSQTIDGQAVNSCDFNTGTCVCSDNFYGLDCSIHAQPIQLDFVHDSTATLSDRTLLVGFTEYFGVKINQTVIASGLNLVIELSKCNSGDSSNPVLLARFNDVPYVMNTSLKSKDYHLLRTPTETLRTRINSTIMIFSVTIVMTTIIVSFWTTSRLRMVWL